MVRTTELLELLIDVAQRRSINNLDPVMLARLVILQLFAPEIYRLGRRHPELVLTMAKWAKEKKGSWRNAQFLKDQLQEVEEQIKNKETQDAGAIRYLENIERPLLLLIQKTCQNRSGFDPRVIMFRLEAEQLSIELLNRYFNLVEEAPAAEPLDDQPDERPTAVIDNIAEFIENLFSAREEVWQAALGQKALQGRVLDDATFKAVLAQYDELDGERAQQMIKNPVWLLHLADHLTGSQQQQFAERTGFITQLEKQLTTDTQNLVDGAENDTIKTSLSLLNEYAVVHWGATLSQQLNSSKQAATDRLLEIIEQGQLEPKIRVKVGDTLARLGDPRFDPKNFYLPSQCKDQPEPHLGFIKIKGGPFMMGSNEDDFGEPRYNEMVNGKAYEVTAVNYDYWMARYPTTVAQYGAFIENGGYDAIDELFQNQNLPWWSQNSVVRLPTEAEWEKAARSGDGRIYPWGDEWDENRLNSGNIGSASSVGMYPSGANPKGIYDLSGNVWEWTHSVLRDYPYQPSKADWQTRQGGDRLVLRGGSWINVHRNTRCAVRNDGNPDDYLNNVGFRVVISLVSDG